MSFHILTSLNLLDPVLWRFFSSSLRWNSSPPLTWKTKRPPRHPRSNEPSAPRGFEGLAGSLQSRQMSQLWWKEDRGARR